MGSLFPCLPDEIGWKCLIRVELNSHHNLRCVCKSWNTALKSPYFYEERTRLKISEQRICMLQYIDGICNKRVAVYDLEKNSCKSLPPIPAEIYRTCHCHFVKQKLVLITDLLADSRRSVWLYDFACSKWRQGANMPRWPNRFASAADEHRGLIYVGGGYDRFHDGVWFGVRSASVYNVEEDKWDVLPDMNTCMENFTGAFVDGKFYVMGSSSSFEVFDSSTRSWKTMENRFHNCRCFISALGRLHCFSSIGLIEYDYSQDRLNIVGTFPTEEMGRFINFAFVVSNKIFVSIWDRIQGPGFYMLEPPSETGGTFKLIGSESPSRLEGSAICAATMDL